MQTFSEERQKLKVLVDNSPDFMGISNNENVIEYLNRAAYTLLGIDPGTDLKTLKSADFYAPHETTHMREIYQAVVEKGSWKGRVLLKHFKTGELIPGYGSYETVIDPLTGKQIGKSTTVRDLRTELASQQALQESEERIRSIVDQTPVAIGVLRGKELVVESGNQTILKVWGKDASIIGKPILEALPEIKGQGFVELLESVYNTGIPFHGNAVLAKLEHNGKIEDVYFDFVYAPLKDAKGEINGVLVVASDVTLQVASKKQAEESELFSRTILFNSPIAKFVLLGSDMVIRSSNEKMMELLGRDDSIIGKKFIEALPELSNSSLMERMLHVYKTGQTYIQPEERLELMRLNKLHVGYYHYIYKALRSTNGEIYGIIVTVMEITDQVVARQKIEEAQASLQGAVDLANLGTWSIDLKERTLDYDARLRSWFGFTENEIITPERSGEPCDKEDLIRLRDAMITAITPGSKGIYDVEYTIKHLRTGLERILHAKGKTFWDAKGEAYKVSGSVRDVTQERKIELELTKQVQQRTEELAAANEELAASNEELQAMNEEMTVINEEMEESNKDLFRTNEELSQYAYVASHDLQEPLRKIRVYTGMLNKQKNLADESRPLVDKISKSSDRMTQLIKDLLEFSRLSKTEVTLAPVNLNESLKDVITDFELSIAEKKATITIEPLPVIRAVSFQMNQLFYNLISNALKFTDPLRSPHISIASRLLSVDEVHNQIERPANNAVYYDITLGDNGIGFDIKYADQVFEVFKRLHSKDIYPGSGIGLALCRRIVRNHGGQLFVRSEIGKGTIFHIILPASHIQ